MILMYPLSLINGEFLNEQLISFLAEERMLYAGILPSRQELLYAARNENQFFI